MIEIIPNWHPVFVHFTVALLSVAVVLHLLALARWPLAPLLRMEAQVVARWSLWLGAGLSLVTALTGWLAYNSVEHDDLSHIAMTDHRNWALVTLALFVVLAVWSLWHWLTRRAPNRGLSAVTFATLLAVGGVLLASTAWRGGELVYRYGLGVMSLPNLAPPVSPTAPPSSPAAGAEAPRPVKPVHDHSTHKH